MTTSFLLTEILYNLFMAWVMVMTVRASLRRVPHLQTMLTLGAGWGVLAMLPVAVVMPWVRAFGASRLFAWAILLHCPLVLAAVAIANWRRFRMFSLVLAAAAVTLAGVAIDACFIEPHWLEITHVTIASAKVTAPLRIALVADIQTDEPGDYERRVFSALVSNRPDLIVFAGDYVQDVSSARYCQASARLETIMHAADMRAPLGAYAVQGSTEPRGIWTHLFNRLPILPCESDTHIDLGQVTLTLLARRSAGNTMLSIPASSNFHVVVGHSPNFALGTVAADLLLAGHTHGGQVCLPLIGPILTFASVPRGWASGATPLPGGGMLIVSRGIGMERQRAPRIRFRCRPELVIIDVVPPANSEAR